MTCQRNCSNIVPLDKAVNSILDALVELVVLDAQHALSLGAVEKVALGVPGGNLGLVALGVGCAVGEEALKGLTRSVKWGILRAGQQDALLHSPARSRWDRRDRRW
jgi:hypothetical protein